MNIMLSKKSVLLLGLIAPINVNAAHNVNIVNNSGNYMQVDFTIPEYTEAQIYLNKLNPDQHLQALLLKAIIKNSTVEIYNAIWAGADINYTSGDMSPLMLAILLKKSESVYYLLECGARPNKAMIECALKVCDIKMAYTLVRKCGIDINTLYNVDGYYGTLLQYAIQHRNLEIVLVLLKNGANFNLNDPNIIPCIYSYYIFSGTPFCGTSCNTGCNMPCNTNCNSSCSPCNTYNTSIILEIVQEIINRGYRVNDIWSHYLIYQMDQVLTLFIRNGANPNYIFKMNNESNYFSTPLFMAINSNSLSAVKVLLAAGADVNLKANSNGYPISQPSLEFKTPLTHAIELGMTDIVELLVEHGARFA